MKASFLFDEMNLCICIPLVLELESELLVVIHACRQYTRAIQMFIILQRSSHLSSIFHYRSWTNYSPKYLPRIYEWRYQLTTLDSTLSIQTLKAIPKQLDIDASVFNPHLEGTYKLSSCCWLLVNLPRSLFN